MSGWHLIYTPHQLIAGLLRQLLDAMDRQPNCVNKAIVYCIRDTDGRQEFLTLRGVETEDKMLVMVFAKDPEPEVREPE